MYCSERTLVKHCKAGVALSVLWCNSWGCEHCGPRRAWKCAEDMKRGLPFMFLTLTVNPKRGIDQEQRARGLLRAWKKWVRQQRKIHGKNAVEYYYVFEAQKSGEPHLHIVGRWPRVEKEEISRWFRDEIDAPSTRIEGIKSANGLAQYLTDYLTKGPTRFGTLKRYGYSRKYFIKARPAAHILQEWMGDWQIVDRPWLDLFHLYWFKGFRRFADSRPGFAELCRPPPTAKDLWPVPTAGLTVVGPRGVAP